MFLLRCLFWLGLVFSQIAQMEGSNAAALADAAARAASAQAFAAGVAATQAGERQCRAEPAKCLALAAQFAGAAKAERAGSGHDSLTSADRAPAWRQSSPADKGI
jgi:hypothetical protein